jgi:hypothetical protein
MRFDRGRLLLMRNRITRLLPLLLCAAQAAFACSASPIEWQRVSSDLTVVITHRGTPIAGIEVQVVRKNSTESVFTGVTDAQGNVLIHGLMVGRYRLIASHEDFQAGNEWIQVVAVPDAKTKTKFDFQWSDDSYQTRTVAGTLRGSVPGTTGNKLMDIVHPVETTFPSVEVTLKDAFSNKEYRTVTDSNGAFLIADVPEGVYILTIAGGIESVNGIADVTRHVVDVTRNTQDTSLPLYLRDTGCYRIEFQLSQCAMEGTIYENGVPLRFCTKG